MDNELIYGFVFDQAGLAQASDLGGLTSTTDGLAWAHLDATHPGSGQWLAAQPSLPPLMANALMADETRPRAQMHGNGFLLVLRGVNLNPGADPEDMISIRLWVEQHRIISTRRRRLLSVEDTVESLSQQPVSSTPDLLVRIASRMINRINDVVDELEQRIADLEEGILTDPAPLMRGRLAELRRESIALRRYLSPQREAFGRLYAEAPAFFSELERQHVRELNDRMIRIVEDIDAVRERAAVVQEELVSMLSDQLNKRMYLLSIVAALFLPLGFLTGLLGVNVGGIPGADHPLGFTIFASVLVFLLIGQIALFVHKKWF